MRYRIRRDEAGQAVLILTICMLTVLTAVAMVVMGLGLIYTTRSMTNHALQLSADAAALTLSAVAKTSGYAAGSGTASTSNNSDAINVAAETWLSTSAHIKAGGVQIGNPTFSPAGVCDGVTGFVARTIVIVSYGGFTFHYPLCAVAPSGTVAS